MLGFALAFALAAGPAIAEDTPAGIPHSCADYYPRDLQRAGISGATKVKFTVVKTGRVKNIVVVESSGNRDLDNMALVCVSHWKYKPATRDGTPIEASWQAKVVWQVPDVPPAPAGTAH